MCMINSDQPEARYINPMTDFGFKKVFGDEAVMTAFLTDLLKPASPIAHITFLDKELQPANALERGVIYDLLCKTEDGREFIVEMQNKGQTHFSDRILYYLSRSIAPQGERGLVEDRRPDGRIQYRNWDFELRPVYGIFFMNFHLKNFERKPLRTIEFVVRETGEVFSDKMRAYTIELPCFNKTQEECSDDLDYWTYLLNHMEMIQTALPFIDEKPIFQRIGDIAELAKMPMDERETYRRSLDAYRSNAATYAYERAEGRAEGIIETARNMKENGVALEIIQKCTGLSPEVIATL